MPQIANIVLKDSLLADHTFNPGTHAGNVSTFVDQSQGRFDLQPVIKVTTRPTASSNDGHKVTVNFSLPGVPATPDGCCTSSKPYANYWTVNTLASKEATLIEKQNLLAYLRNYVQTEEFGALVLGQNYF